MFEFQILHADPKSKDYNFSTSTYELKDGELFGYYGNNSARLYIGDGKTALGQLRYIGQDIEEGTITRSTITGGTLNNVTINGNTLSGGFNCSGATLTSGKLMGFYFDGCNIPTDNTLTNNGTINNTGGTITGGTLSGNAFISGNTNTDITGGKIAGSTIKYAQSVTLENVSQTFTDVGYIGTQGSEGDEKFFSTTGYPSYIRSFTDSVVDKRCLDIRGRTVINEDGKFYTNSALIDGGTDKTVKITNSDLSVNNNFPDEIDTNVTSANYLSNSTTSATLTFKLNEDFTAQESTSYGTVWKCKNSKIINTLGTGSGLFLISIDLPDSVGDNHFYGTFLYYYNHYVHMSQAKNICTNVPLFFSSNYESTTILGISLTNGVTTTGVGGPAVSVYFSGGGSFDPADSAETLTLEVRRLSYN